MKEIQYNLLVKGKDLNKKLEAFLNERINERPRLNWAFWKYFSVFTKLDISHNSACTLYNWIRLGYY